MASADLIAELIEAGTPPALVAKVAMELGKAEAERAIAEHRLSRYDALPAVRISASGRVKRRKIGKTLRLAVIERDGSACVYCGCYTDYPHLDHRIPASRGGDNSLENLCVACEPCNLSKGALTPEEWMQ